MSQVKIDENAKAVLAEWVGRAVEAERTAAHAREAIASILRIIVPGIDPERIRLDARTMTVTVLDTAD